MYQYRETMEYKHHLIEYNTIDHEYDIIALDDNFYGDSVICAMPTLNDAMDCIDEWYGEELCH